jgi:hypothetical protein
MMHCCKKLLLKEIKIELKIIYWNVKSPKENHPAGKIFNFRKNIFFKNLFMKENLKTDFANTNEQYARMALLTKQTPSAVVNRVIKKYREAYKPMGIPTTSQVFEFYKKEQELLPLLNFKLVLVNVDYIPTNEEPLKKYAARGYKVFHIAGTSHYPMIENPEQLNRVLEQAIEESFPIPPPVGGFSRLITVIV